MKKTDLVHIERKTVLGAIAILSLFALGIFFDSSKLFKGNAAFLAQNPLDAESVECTKDMVSVTQSPLDSKHPLVAGNEQRLGIFTISTKNCKLSVTTLTGKITSHGVQVNNLRAGVYLPSGEPRNFSAAEGAVVCNRIFSLQTTTDAEVIQPNSTRSFIFIADIGAVVTSRNTDGKLKNAILELEFFGANRIGGKTVMGNLLESGQLQGVQLLSTECT